MSNNKLAIILTKAIESDLVNAFLINRESPSFYNIRENILNVLNRYMETLGLNCSESPLMIGQMPPKQYEDFVNYQLKKQAYIAVEEILKKDGFFKKFIYEDEYQRHTSITREIIVLKTEKIYQDENRVSDELIAMLKKARELREQNDQIE